MQVIAIDKILEDFARILSLLKGADSSFLYNKLNKLLDSNPETAQTSVETNTVELILQRKNNVEQNIVYVSIAKISPASQINSLNTYFRLCHTM